MRVAFFSKKRQKDRNGCIWEGGKHEEGQRSCTGFLLRKLPFHSSTYISVAIMNHMKHFGFLHSEAILIDTQKFK